MENECHFDQKNYFLNFQLNNDEIRYKSIDHINENVHSDLECFVDDLKCDRNKTIERFLAEKQVNDIFIFVGRLLSSSNNRVCGNCAFILGSTIENERGLERFLAVFKNESTLKIVDIILILCQLLAHSDLDCVLNASGTLGTICAVKEGRDLMIKHVCIPQVIHHSSKLLSSTNSWIASNAALILARISIDEIGCQMILTHDKHGEILNKLLDALDINDLSRSTNIAFTIARLIEGENGRKILINDCGQNKLLEALLLMLGVNEDNGIRKNACYALSCLCANQYGYQLCIESITLFRKILILIETTLYSVEHETVWFALMCLTTIATNNGALEHLFCSKNLLNIIKNVQDKWQDKDIQDESKLLWQIIYKSIKPNRPTIDQCRDTSAHVSWEPYLLIVNDDQMQYRIILDDVQSIITKETKYFLNSLKPNTRYNVKIQCVTTQGETNPSDPTIFHTEEGLPPGIINLRVVCTTTTTVRVAWDVPDLSNCSSFRGFQIYLNDIEYECTSECNTTLNFLSPNTPYRISVCIMNMKGKGPRCFIDAETKSSADVNPAPPTLTFIGRRELHIKWQPPEIITGRLFRYELTCNARCIYSGTDQEYHANMLKSDTEYVLTVSIITNEGRFRSRPVIVRTLKDEHNTTYRHSLYNPSLQKSLKRSNTFVSPKVSVNVEKRLSKEMILPSHNIQITTIRPLDIKSQFPSYSRTLPGAFRQSPPHLSRCLSRSKTDLSPKPTHATIIIPTLNLNNQTQLIHSSRSRSLQYLAATKTIQRSSSTSFYDSTYGLSRIS